MIMIFKKNNVIIRHLGLMDWTKTFKIMNYFTNIRNIYTIDEIWFVEHYPVFTQGQIKHKYYNKYIHNIPVVHSNRGGKITYHAPGQQIIYLLLDLKRFRINIKELLYLIENIILQTLYQFSIDAYNSIKNPGIYVNNKKICSIGLRVTKGCCLHGFALNINLDLKPFKYIDPCGDNTLIMTKMSDYNKNINIKTVNKILINKIALFFNINCIFIH